MNLRNKQAYYYQDSLPQDIHTSTYLVTNVEVHKRKKKKIIQKQCHQLQNESTISTFISKIISLTPNRISKTTPTNEAHKTKWRKQAKPPKMINIELR